MGLLDLLSTILSSPTTKKIAKHVQDHKGAYIAAGTVAAAGAVGTVSYKVGKAKGHVQGKKEGTAEQAKRDNQKFEQQAAAHNHDRQEWQKVCKEKDKLIGDLADNKSWD